MKSLKRAIAVIAGLMMPTGATMAATLPTVFTAPQASAGAPLFSQNCATCHGADLKGGAGPALLGQAFAAVGNGYTIGAMFSEVAEQMPANAPGSLTHGQYEDVMAYILQTNGYPAGGKVFGYDAGLISTIPLVSQEK